MSLCRMFVMGRLGADPEYKTTRSGQPLLKMRIATGDRRRVKDGEWEDFTQWHSATCWGKLADRYNGMLRKGQMVHIEGPLRSNKWTGTDGQERTFWEVDVRNLEFCERKDISQGDHRTGAPPANAQMYNPSTYVPQETPQGSGGASTGPAPFENDDDDCPF
jgi:single-strand DNA-binding protein